MSDDTPATPPSAALYPILVTPPESGNSMENPILISDSDGPDASDTETLCELVRQLSDNSPSPSPRAQRLTRHSGHVNRSQVNSSVKQPDHVENTTESGRNLSDPGGDPSLDQVIIGPCTNPISMLQRTTRLIGIPSCQLTVKMAVPLRRAVTQGDLSKGPPRRLCDQCRSGSWKPISRR